MRRIHLINVLVYPCGGTRRLPAAIHDPVSIRKVLAAMGPAAGPEARAVRDAA